MDLLRQLNIQGVNAGAYSGYTWVSKSTGSLLDSINPANKEKIASVATSSLEDYEQLITRAQKAALAWRKVPAPLRGDIIRQIAQALREKKDVLGSLVSLEMGKSKQEGDGEVQEMIDIADFAVGQSRMLYGKTMHSERPQHRMYEQWHPYGVVGIVSAFNFPVAVWAWNAFIAAICGNVTLWKPSSKTPLCAIATHTICNAVLQKNGCPDIFSLMIPESHSIAETFINDARVALVSFTGSTKTGKHVAKCVAGRLGRSILELGGNNGIVLEESANLKLAIPAIVFGAIGTAGQRCTSTRRLFIHASIYAEVLSQLTAAFAQVSIGDPLNSSHLMGPLIDAHAVVAFKQAISEAKALGGKILFGGNAIESEGFFVQPTLISGLNNSCPLVQKETFAPILYVMQYKALAEVIVQHNGVPQGLSSAIFTRDLQSAEVFLSADGSDCGIANVNIGTSGAEIGGAFGGEKETGGGRESGSDAWKGYMRRQTNTINWGDALPLAQGIRFILD